MTTASSSQNDGQSWHNVTSFSSGGHHGGGGALDMPLPVASAMRGVWKPREKMQRTPKHLATLLPSSNSKTGNAATTSSTISSTDPRLEDGSGMVLCLAGDEYIVVANLVTTKLKVYRLSTSSTNIASVTSEILPWSEVTLLSEDSATIGGGYSAAIVCLKALPYGKSLIYGETCRRQEELHLVAFSDDGQGFVIRIRKDDCASKVFEFQTLNFGVTCVTFIPTSQGSPDCQLLVGYQSGYIENWKLFRFTTEKILAKMLWRGKYPSGYSIQQIAPLHLSNSTAAAKPSNNSFLKNNGEENTETISKKETSTEESTKTQATHRGGAEDAPHRYVLVTLHCPKYTLKTNAMLEVMDIGSMVQLWKSNKDEPSQRLRAVDLGKQWVMNAPGMELVNSSTIHKSNDPTIRRRAFVIPSSSSGSICKSPSGNCVALADGTIALVSSLEDDSGCLQWGIRHDYNQLLLPYPAIGCASLSWSQYCDDQYGDRSVPYVACCLRGGSTYLIPFANASAIAESTPITVFVLPKEVSFLYVQAFTAGNLVLSSGDKGPTKTTPALIYGWTGGILDVYSCDLVDANDDSSSCRPMIGSQELAALEELIDNGTVPLLQKKLSSSKEADPILNQPLWMDAWKEVQKTRSAERSLAVKDLVSPDMAAIRSLLLLLCSEHREVTEKIAANTSNPNATT